MSNIYIVAEIGCNHNGSVDIAREMILKAKEAGVNAVKFQTFKADKLISAIAPKAEYQIKNTGECRCLQLTNWFVNHVNQKL